MGGCNLGEEEEEEDIHRDGGGFRIWDPLRGREKRKRELIEGLEYDL